MKKINFENLPSTNTPISAGNLNQMQSNIEESAVIVSPTEPTTSEKVWIQKGKNMVKEWQKGSFYSIDTHTFKENNQFAKTGYIKVQPNVDYIFSHSLGNHNGYIACFDENYNFLKVINDQAITTSFKITNANVKYIVVNMWHETDIANESDVQLEQGTIATSYEAYIEPKIHVKNDNGVYEEFISKEDTLERYSTNEQKIGTWHNGNDIYRKTLLIDVSNFNAEQEYVIRYSDYGINGNIVVNNYKGLCGRADNRWQVLPCTLEDWHIDIFDFLDEQFTLKISQNQKNLGVTIMTLVLEYEYRNW